MPPRGAVKRLLEHMAARPHHPLWEPDEVANLLGCPKLQIHTRLRHARDNGLIYVHHQSPRKVKYSLQPPPEGQTPPDDQAGEGAADEPGSDFSACLWSDGELVLRGVRSQEDGSLILTADQVTTVKALLTGTLHGP